MKFSGKTCLKIILKVTKKQGFTFSLEDTFSENHRGDQIDPPAISGLKQIKFKLLNSNKETEFY